MKRIISLLLALLLLFALAGCDKKEDGTSSTSNDPGYIFTAKETRIAMNQDASSILSALGEPVSYTEEASCAFDGLDKTYYYGGFYLTTYPDNDKDYVYTLWFADDSVSTEEGIYIGSTKEDVEKAYGAEGFTGKNSYTYKKGASRLVIILTDGVVSSVQYEAIVE